MRRLEVLFSELAMKIENLPSHTKKTFEISV